MTTTAQIDTSRWRQHRPLKSAAALGALVFLVIGTTFTFVGLLPRSAAGLLTLVGAVVGGVSTLVVVMRTVRARFTRRRLTVRSTDDALGVPGDRVIPYGLIGASFGYLLFFLGLGLLIAAEARSGAWISIVVGGLAVGLGVPMLWRLFRGRYRVNWLELTREELRSHGYIRTYVLAWDDIVALTIRLDPSPVVIARGRVAPVITGPTETLGESSVGGPLGNEIHVPIATAGSSLAAIAELIDFYLTHPKARAELADVRAVERIRDGRLGV